MSYRQPLVTVGFGFESGVTVPPMNIKAIADNKAIKFTDIHPSQKIGNKCQETVRIRSEINRCKSSA
ncbi:MAG: hypothetical protein WBQ79_06875 [Acidobacteriaceae bacterium]